MTMKTRPDGRGSVHQRDIFDIVKKIYPTYKVVYELYIPELGQRYDIFVLDLGIAIEYDGEQHNRFVEHFHKDTQGYLDSISLDVAKVDFSESNGIKIVRFSGEEDWNENMISEAIESVSYPDTSYDSSIFENKNVKLEIQRDRRREQYARLKEYRSRGR